MILEAALFAVAATLATLRWLRVVQREHYLGGSVLAMARVWVRTRRPNLILALIPPLGLAWSLVGGHRLSAVVVVCGALAVFPVGLSLRGRTSRLAWTPRLKRLAAIVGVLLGVAAALLIPKVEAATPALVVLYPLMLELAILVSTPLEHRLSQRFVDTASVTLKRVGPTVVAITGSFGKTSTKTYVRDIIGGARRVVASPASFNNRLGLSRAINEHLTPDAEVFIAEMGTYGAGEIAEMVDWVRPDIAVMTAIGPVHLERFRTEANIVAAKSEILATARVGIFNVDNDALGELADAQTGIQVVRCGTGESATDVRVTATVDGHQIEVGGSTVGVIPDAGLYPSNLACAIAVAIELGVPVDEIMKRAQGLSPPAHRQTVSASDAGFTIIDDTFNSNPAGAEGALEVLASLGGPQARRVVVTPGMIELGERQDEANEGLARAAAQLGDVVIVGRTNRAALLRGTEGSGASVNVVGTRQDAVDWVRSKLGPGDVVLYENDLPDHYP